MSIKARRGEVEKFLGSMHGCERGRERGHGRGRERGRGCERVT